MRPFEGALASLACLAATAGCGKTTGSSPAPAASAAAATATATMACDAVFAPPPGGDLLCDEHVLPTTGVKDEIHWRSYGLAEDRMTVCDRYLAAARACKYGFAFKPPACDVSDDQGRRAEVFFKEARSWGGAAYPKCDHAPEARHATVVVISEQPSDKR